MRQEGGKEGDGRAQSVGIGNCVGGENGMACLGVGSGTGAGAGVRACVSARLKTCKTLIENN